MVYLDDGLLVLKIQDALLGVLDTKQRIVKIEPKALEDIWINWEFFRDRLVLAPKRVELLDLVPGEHRNTVELRVWRKYRQELMRLVEECEALR